MSNLILPTPIIGPAIVTYNGKSFYTDGGVKENFKRDTFTVKADFSGQQDERAKSQYTEISFQPDGQISGLTKYFPYTPAMIGSSIFGSSALPLVIVTKFGGAANTGQTITYPRAALTKLPQLRLQSDQTLFGDMTFTAIGIATAQPNTSNYWQTLADAVFADATYDETTIISDVYSAAYGSTPYAAIGSNAGFVIDIEATTAPVMCDGWGVVDMSLESITAKAKFAPSNLTQAQLYTLLANQGTGYVYPGQSLSKSNTDLVIVGSGNAAKTLTVTIKNAGVKQAGLMYGVGKHRFDAVEFTSKLTWTTGVVNPLFSLAIA